MSWIDIASVDDIPVLGARLVKTPLGCIAIFRTSDDEVFAASNTCPHKQGPLNEGIVHGHHVTCPLHNWVFDLKTGDAVGEDARIDTFKVRLEHGRVLLDGDLLTRKSAA